MTTIDAPFTITNTVFSPTDNLHFYISTLTLTSANAIPSEAGTYSVVVFDADGAVNTTNASLTFSGLPAAPATDNFAARGALTGQFSFSGILVATNIGATSEPGEPTNGIPGGASVWLKWVAPFTGLATFDTSGSDFDTTIGIYTNRNPASPSVNNLGSVANDDDMGVYFGSLARFNAVSNQEYEISIDGFYGATGHIMLKWANNTGGGVIAATSQPHNIVVTNHADVTLTVDFGFTNNFFNWSFNGVQLTQTVNSITISNVTAANVGTYTVNSGRSALYSQPIQLQISDDGFTNSFAQAKFRLATDTTFTPSLKIHPLIAPVSGFTGTHIWNTYGAASEPGEPNHCGKAGGAPYWFSYQAPANGYLNLDANTPTFTNVLAVYTWPGGDFSTLVPVDCASTNNGVGDEMAVFAVTNGTIYYLVVDGLNAATGPVTLSYNLVIPVPPGITTPPQSQIVNAGASPTFTVTATGTAPLSYQWLLGGTNIPGANTNTYTRSNVQAGDAGNYSVVVTNNFGSVTSAVATLTVNPVTTLAGWDVSGQSAYGISPLSPTTNAPNLTITGLTRGAGVTTVPTGAARAWGGTGFISVSEAAAIAANQYATFSVAANSGCNVSFTSVSRFDYRRSSNGPTNGVLQYQIGSGGFTDITTVSYASSATTGASLGAIDLSGIAALQNVAAGSVVTFRIVNYGASASSGTWYVFDVAGGTAPDLTVQGTINSNAPAITTQPQSQTVAQGSNVTLTVQATGTPPPAYQWRTNTVKFQGQTNTSLTVTNFQSARQGNYDVVVTNTAGSVTSSVAALYLNSPMHFGGLSLSPTGGLSATLLGMANTNYIIQASTNLATTNWLAIATNNSPSGIISITDTNIKNFPGRFYRAVPQ